MKKTLLTILSLVIISTMLLSACATATTEAPKPTDAPAVVAEPTEAPVAVEEPTEAPVAVEEPTEAPVVEEPTDPNAEIAANLPRNETLYYNGLQWGPVVGWNPYSSNNNNALGVTQGANARVIIFETPYVYNMLDGKQYPLLADGDWAWNEDMTEITYKIKPAAQWSDGTPVTAEDAAYTWDANLKYETTVGVGARDYVDDVVAVDTLTVVVKAKLDENGKAINPLAVMAFISDNYIIQKAWTETLEARTGGDAAAFKADPGDDFVASGPYTKLFADDSKVVYVRDDNYWGQDASMWGKLPAPKYIAHVIYADNNAGFLALKAGEVDVSQQFNANVQDLWLVDKLPISTYLDEAPYGVSASLPTAYFNLNIPALQNIAVRRAIAIAVDYDTIIANAMTNQSPTFTQVPRSIMNPTTGEQALYDHEAVADLQWAGNDIEGAIAILDEAGIVDTDGDGWRELDGEKISLNASCPNGWSDWQAAMEVVAAAGEKIGIEITTLFPEWSVYQTVFTDGAQTEYDIFMVWSNGAGPTNPWGRARQLMYSGFAGTQGNWNGNWGGYVNPRVDELIALIPGETDQAKLVEYYTELTEIYLTDIPSFTLMYRPDQFYTVGETVWTNFPASDDGLNIPPMNLTDGYSIAGLYVITLINP
ncbi:MAG TPA: ABC transporter substrate-binding protein [Anaerolineales bacterium]|nr:ABC transporter substrate-binding protein [Anaerolineales bacterium]